MTHYDILYVYNSKMCHLLSLSLSLLLSLHLSPSLSPLHSTPQVGNLQNSYKSVQKSLHAFPDHIDSQELLSQLKQHFAALWQVKNTHTYQLSNLSSEDRIYFHVGLSQHYHTYGQPDLFHTVAIIA